MVPYVGYQDIPIFRLPNAMQMIAYDILKKFNHIFIFVRNALARNRKVYVIMI
jgi:hypothetical protein